MRKKSIGIFVCMMMLTTCVLPVNGTINESNDKKASISPGDNLRFMTYDMSLRSYWIYIPSSYDGSIHMPLVIALHGATERAMTMMSIYAWNTKADEEGFIVVYPNGHTAWREFYELRWALVWLISYGWWGFWWNPCDVDRVDDVGFIRTLIENLQANLNINSSRFYITGFSAGAMMTYRLGAELSDTISAIAPVAGTIGGHWTEDSPPYIIPPPKHPLPVITFHGTNDSFIPYNGRWDFLSVNESVSFWVEHNGCNPIPKNWTSESGKIIRNIYTKENLGTEVVLYTTIDGEHIWPGNPWDDPNGEISATDLIWEFFKAHPKQ